MFPLFRLDRLALEVVLKQLDPVELLELSQCSARSHRIIKYFTFLHNYTIALQITSETVFEIRQGPKTYQFAVLPTEKSYISSLRRLRGVNFLMSTTSYSQNTYWDDTDQGIQVLYHHFKELFRKPIYSLVMSGGVNIPCKVLRYIVAQQGRFEWAQLHLRKSNKIAIYELLDVLKTTNNIIIDFEPMDISRYSFKYIQIFEPPPTLSGLNGETINFMNRVYSSDETNQILKSWIDGACPSLKVIGFDVNDHNVKDFLDGIEYITKNEPLIKSHSACLVKSQPYEITSRAGAKATISKFVDTVTGDIFLGMHVSNH